MSTIIVDISFLSLIDVRCFRMYQVLGVHFFRIKCHLSFFLFNLLFPFLLSRGFTLGFFWQYRICSLVFPIYPLCSFVKCFISLFLIVYVKGQIDYHLEEFVMVVLLAQKLCPKLNAIMCLSHA